MSNTDTLEDIKLDEKIIKEIKEPSKYNIIFLNIFMKKNITLV